MATHPDFFGLTLAPPATPPASGWVRDLGPPATVRLATLTDQVSVGNALAQVGRKLSVYTVGVDQGIRTVALASTDNVLDTGVAAEPFLRLSLDASGTLSVGSGAAPVDVQLARAAADRWACGLGDSMEVAGTGLLAARAALADANPTAALDTSRLRLGLNSADNLSWSLGVATATNRADMGANDELGANGTGFFSVRAALADPNPTAALTSTALKLGINSADNLSVRVAASANKTLTVDDGVGGDATLLVRTLGTVALRSDTVTRGANRVGRLVVAAGADPLLATDDNVGYDATAGNQTPTLPDLATNRGMTVTVLRVPGDVSGNTCIVTPTGADTVWGNPTKPMLAGTSATFYAAPSGTEWWIL